MDGTNDFLNERLNERISQNLLRKLENKNHLIDFASNDYLGFACSERLKELIEIKIKNNPFLKNGSTGSRLISGNSSFTEKLERKIAVFHSADAGLLFNSGYDANVGLFSCIAQKGDTILTDELVHASIIDGVRLSYANRERFRHNDLNDLEEKLKKAKGNIFIGVESVYSMDGDLTPLKKIVALAEKYNANMIVDEAHATGVFGKQGEGRVVEENLENKVFARIHTFGKGLGVHGAMVLGSQALRMYLINFARSFIYTTALSPHALCMIDGAYDLLPESQEERKKIFELIQYFKENLHRTDFEFLESDTPIQGIIVPGNEQAKAVALQLEEAGFYAKAILSPTVPKGKERLRICIHAFNTKDEIDNLIKVLVNAQHRNILF